MPTTTNTNTNTAPTTAPAKGHTTITSGSTVISQIGGVRRGQTYTTPNRNQIRIVGIGGAKAMHAPIVAMAAWCADHMQINNVQIDLRIAKTIKGGDLGNAHHHHKTGGQYAGPDQTATTAANCGRWYTAHVQIATADRTIDQVLSTVCHEIVHVYQYHKGQLTLTPCNTARVWAGNAAYGKHGVYPVGALKWADRPWEKHAVAMQGRLLAAYTTANPKTAAPGATRTRQTDRWATGWAAKPATVAKFAQAIKLAQAAGQTTDQGVITVGLDQITGAGLGASWLRKAHGWYPGKPCHGAAAALGYTAILDRTIKALPVVHLTPATPAA